MQALDDLDLLFDNTLIYYITGDNGASAEGSTQGSFNEAIGLNAPERSGDAGLPRASAAEFGTPSASTDHYAVGWAHAMCTPYQWTKQVASHWGGTRNGTIVHWPAASPLRRAPRAAVRPRHRRRADHPGGRPPARAQHGARGHPAPIEGVSMGYSFDDATAPERHQTQYFEIAGNRGIYHRRLDRSHQAPHALAAAGRAAGRPRWTG